MSSDWLVKIYRDIRPNLVYDVIKFAVLAGVSVIALVMYRLLAWARDIPQDRVIDAVILILALALIFGGSYLLSRFRRTPEAASPNSPSLQKKSRIFVVLCLASVVVLFVGGLVFYKAASVLFATRDSKGLMEVRENHFTNERVGVDGKHFINCTFTNVKLVYNGGLFAFEGNSFEGATWVRTENDAVGGTMVLLKLVGATVPAFPLVGPEGRPLENVEAPILIGRPSPSP